MIQTLFGAKEREPGLFERLKAGIRRTRETLAERLEEVFSGKVEIDRATVEELEAVLITADIGVRTVNELLEQVRAQLDRKQATNPAQLRQMIRDHLLQVLRATERPPATVTEPPMVVLVVGVNGTGKTTTIGKLAWRLRQDGHRVLLCAADTFRAAAIEQLEVWAQRAGAELVRQSPGADPAAVLFDALQAAKSRGVSHVIADTAGRLHTKSNLMAELEKMCRVAARVVPGAPHEVLLVIDATTGQNGLEQARKFTETCGVTGIVLTKLDGTAKGGIVVAIARELGLPIRYVGVGEKIDDLLPFDAEKFVNSLIEA